MLTPSSLSRLTASFTPRSSGSRLRKSQLKGAASFLSLFKKGRIAGSLPGPCHSNWWGSSHGRLLRNLLLRIWMETSSINSGLRLSRPCRRVCSVGSGRLTTFTPRCRSPGSDRLAAFTEGSRPTLLTILLRLAQSSLVLLLDSPQKREPDWRSVIPLVFRVAV